MIELILHILIFLAKPRRLLLAAEMLGGNGYLLWSGVAAVVTGPSGLAPALDWAWQGTLFAVLTLLAAWLWWRWLNRRLTSETADAHLNQRGSRLSGVLRWTPRW
jgi:membrane protein implicated in regulation of membrane protease activity